MEAAPLKRHHQSEKSRRRGFLAATRSRPSIRRRGDIFDELSASARKTNDGGSSNRRARKIRDDSFARASILRHFLRPSRRERERSVSSFSPRGTSILGLAFNLSLLPSFPSAAIDSTLSISRIRHVLANRFRFCLLSCRYKEKRYLSRFLAREIVQGMVSFFFVLETSVLWNFEFRLKKLLM